MNDELDQMTTATAGWCAHVDGHIFDLEYCEQCLKPPFDPWCERIPLHDGRSVPVLRSAAFCDSETAEETRLRALPIISQLNGALAAVCRAEPLNLKWIGRIREDGRVDVTNFAVGTATGRSKMTAHAEVRGPSGNLVPPPPPEPSVAQRWLRMADENDDIADLLTFVGRADNWFDIYKALEVAERLAGGSERQLATVIGASWGDVKRTKQTANSERHAHRGKHSPPADPTSLSDARSLLAFVVRTVMGAVESPASTAD